MGFASPQFFFLLVPLAFLGWFHRSLGLHRPLRALLLLLLVLALADPYLPLRSGAMNLWVLVDRSASARDLVEPRLEEWRSLIERSRPTPRDEVHWIDYATEVIPQGASDLPASAIDGGLTRTALAIRDTLARTDQREHHRILLFTDGYSTEPLDGIADSLLAAQVPLDTRELKQEGGADFRLVSVTAPERVQVGEPYVVDLLLASTTPEAAPVTVPLTLSRGGKQLFTRDVTIQNGVGRLRLADRIVQPGSHRYEARIAPAQDAAVGNNSMDRWIEVAAGPRLLLVTAYPDDPVATLLQAQGFAVEVITETLTLSPGALSGARAVIFHNVAAYEVNSEFLSSLAFFVEEQGGGLAMIGGKHSFGSGGYFESAIDPLLPVSMELKSEHRKLSVAMAIVMDRSGSMAATTPSGHTKMHLADEGAARAVELLGDGDAVTVYAVDSEAHQICKLMNVGTSRGELINRIRRIESTGGGIYVYKGMQAAWEELQKADVGQRHLILFSDAADSEEPGDYLNLLKEMRAEGATVSVIGLGTRSDADAKLLEDIAEKGAGRIFFTDVAAELPGIFAQETVTVARSAFLEETIPTQSTGRWLELASRDLTWLAQADGYNLSYIRENDEAALVSKDSYVAPLVAFGRRGLGKTAAVTFPLGGEFSDSSRSWEQVGDFTQTLARWLVGDDIPSGLGLRHQLRGTELTLDLFYDPAEWSEKLATRPPGIVLTQGFDNGERFNEVWERLAPGHYSARRSLKQGEPWRGAVQVQGAALPFGPIALGNDAEWQFDSARVAELRETSRASGGNEILDLTQAWRKPNNPETGPIRTWFLAVATVLFLLEALATRTGWRMPSWIPVRAFAPKIRKRRMTEGKAAPAAKNSPATESPQNPLPDPEAPLPAPAIEDPAEKRRQRFDRAKKRK